MPRERAPRLKSTIDAAASRLRALARAAKADALLGSEEALVAQLGVSRATLRQVARLLEREGLLKVRRGINGGYFAARPDLRTVENAVSTYLDMVDTDVMDTTAVGFVLWVEVINTAAAIRSEKSRTLAQGLRERVNAVRPDASSNDVLRIEQEIRTAIFGLIRSRYIELIFQINIAFAARRFPHDPSDRDDTAAHRAFVRAWRNTTLLELDAIADGDQALGEMAARHLRNLWDRRLRDDRDS